MSAQTQAIKARAEYIAREYYTGSRDLAMAALAETDLQTPKEIRIFDTAYATAAQRILQESAA